LSTHTKENLAFRTGLATAKVSGNHEGSSVETPRPAIVQEAPRPGEKTANEKLQKKEKSPP